MEVIEIKRIIRILQITYVKLYHLNKMEKFLKRQSAKTE